MAAIPSREKYPTYFKVVKASDSFIGKELTLFLVTGVVSKRQYKQVAVVIEILSEQEIETDKFVISTLLNQERLEKLNKYFEPLSKEWRGQFYALANAIVEACNDALKS